MPRRRHMPRAVHPTGVQLEYYATLKAMVAHAHALVKARLVPRLEELIARHNVDSAEHLDAQPPGRRVNTIMEGITQAWLRRFPQKRMEALATKIAKATADHQDRELNRQISGAMGVQFPDFTTKKLTARIGQFTAENVSLIKSIPRDYFGQVEQTVLEGVREGARWETVAGQVEERFGVAQSRAKLIARDQVGKFYAELNETRQKQLGVTQYIWRTSNDERVREWHKERDGNVYDWSDGPGDASDPGDGEHPGEGINCRCNADPVLDDLIEG